MNKEEEQEGTGYVQQQEGTGDAQPEGEEMNDESKRKH